MMMMMMMMMMIVNRYELIWATMVEPVFLLKLASHSGADDDGDDNDDKHDDDNDDADYDDDDDEAQKAAVPNDYTLNVHNLKAGSLIKIVADHANIANTQGCSEQSHEAEEANSRDLRSIQVSTPKKQTFCTSFYISNSDCHFHYLYGLVKSKVTVSVKRR